MSLCGGDYIWLSGSERLSSATFIVMIVNCLYETITAKVMADIVLFSHLSVVFFEIITTTIGSSRKDMG